MPPDSFSLAPSARNYLLFGGLLLVAYFCLLQLLPTGPFEFSYYPFVPAPMPFSPMRGFTYEQLAGHLFRLLLATPALLLLSIGLYRALPFETPPKDTHLRLAWWVSLLSLALMCLLLFFVFQGRAVTNDELAYKVQATLLLQGKLAYNDIPYPPTSFEPFMVATRLGITGKYLFGEPLVQMPGVLLGYPALLHIPLAGLTLLCIYRMVALSSDEPVFASWAVILVAASPMFLLTTVTGQSQATSLCCLSLAGLGWAQMRQDQPWQGALLLAIGIGFGMTVRPQSAAPVGLILGATATWMLLKRRQIVPLLLMFALLGAFAASLLLYNNALTGHPLRLPWDLARPTEHYGFGRVWNPFPFEHTPWRALENLLVTGLRWNAWWLGWPSGFLLLWLWARMKYPLEGCKLWLWAGGALLLFELGYYSTGISDTGPLYHYELLLPAALLGARAIQRGFQQRPAWTVTLLVLHFGLGSVSFLWTQTQRNARLLAAIHKDTDKALAHIQRAKKPALLLYERDCSEALYSGWILQSFPRRSYANDARVVIFPRPPYRWLREYIRRYPKRMCYYYRRNPRTKAPELHRCHRALPLLRRPVRLGRKCMWNPCTACKKGWYDPWKASQRWFKPTPR